MARVLKSVKVLSVLIGSLLVARVLYFAYMGMPDDALVSMHPAVPVGMPHMAAAADGTGEDVEEAVRAPADMRAPATPTARAAAPPTPPATTKDTQDGNDGAADEQDGHDGQARHPATSPRRPRRSWRAKEVAETPAPVDNGAATGADERDASGASSSSSPAAAPPTPGELEHANVHLFYYMWYTAVDEASSARVAGHWNHNILPHWNEGTKRKFVHDVTYEPWNEDIGSSFFPARGLYTSTDPALVDAHMAELSGFVIVVSWWGRPELPNTVDGEGVHSPDLTFLMESASRHGVGVAFHLEPYPDRTAQMIHDDFCYLVDTYGHHASFYRDSARGHLPVYYAYDAYKVPAPEWARVLGRDGDLSVRGTEYDALVIALMLSNNDYNFVRRGAFDGVYTYFAADGFTYGSTPSRWGDIAAWAHEHGLLVSLSVGPGYDDERIRPWNAANTKGREEGKYYSRHWARAAAAGADIVSVTSYNEWGEGTQVEAVVPKAVPRTILTGKPHTYRDYTPHAPSYYMDKTREYAAAWREGEGERIGK